MNRRGLLIATLVLVLFTGLLLGGLSWFASLEHGSRRSGASASTEGWMHQPGHPRHWRDLLLKH
jgi:hypothetical protein